MNGEVVIVQNLYLSAQTNAQVMVSARMMEAVIVTLDGQVLIVQFQSQRLPV